MNSINNLPSVSEKRGRFAKLSLGTKMAFWCLVFYVILFFAMQLERFLRLHFGPLSNLPLRIFSTAVDFLFYIQNTWLWLVGVIFNDSHLLSGAQESIYGRYIFFLVIFLVSMVNVMIFFLIGLAIEKTAQRLHWS